MKRISGDLFGICSGIIPTKGFFTKHRIKGVPQWTAWKIWCWEPKYDPFRKFR